MVTPIFFLLTASFQVFCPCLFRRNECFDFFTKEHAQWAIRECIQVPTRLSSCFFTGSLFRFRVRFPGKSPTSFMFRCVQASTKEVDVTVFGSPNAYDLRSVSLPV